MLRKKYFPFMLKLVVLILSAMLTTQLWAVETCSRLATINFQEVLVDVSSSNRGEGLRYYLEKDQVAKQLLDEYQVNNKPSWKDAAASTIGSAMILAGLLRTNAGENETFTSRNGLIIGGATLIGVSYLVSKTKQYNNEYLLSKSVEEYNRRNTPRIFFSPTNDLNGLGIGVGQEF